MVLYVADHGTFRDGSDRQNVTNDESRLLAAVNELAGVHTLGRYEQLVLLLVPERVSEGDLGKWSSTTRIVNNIGHDSFEISISLAEIEASEPCRSFAVVGVGFEY
jgi:hypothetical protein